MIGLFLLSSDADTQSTLFPDDKAQRDTAAVVINTDLYGMDNATNIQDAIAKWRVMTEPFTSSYAVRTPGRINRPFHYMHEIEIVFV